MKQGKRKGWSLEDRRIGGRDDPPQSRILLNPDSRNPQKTIAEVIAHANLPPSNSIAKAAGRPNSIILTLRSLRISHSAK